MTPAGGNTKWETILKEYVVKRLSTVRMPLERVGENNPGKQAETCCIL